MKILFLSQYYPPESNAPAVRVSELAERWAAAGHEVSVLTAFPHHPTGVVPPEYRGQWFKREIRNGVTVLRSYIYVAANRGVIRRSLSYASWMLSVILLAQWRAERPDVVIATSPQILCAVAGWIVSMVKRRPFVMEVRDLWPDSIIAVGALREGLVVKALRIVERTLYRRAHAIVIVSPGFRAHFDTLHLPPAKLHLLPNGVDLSRFHPDPSGPDPYAASGVTEHFRVLYSGTVGMAHGLEVMVGAAEKLRGEDVALVVVGEGARRSQLMEDAVRRKVLNVYFLPIQPRNDMPRWINSADAVVVHLKGDVLFEGVLPSKVFEYMGCAKPVLIGVGGTASQLVHDAQCGWSFTPDSVDELVALTQYVRQHPAEAGRRGAQGRRFVEEHYDRDRLAHQYISEILIPLVETHPQQ